MSLLSTAARWLRRLIKVMVVSLVTFVFLSFVGVAILMAVGIGVYESYAKTLMPPDQLDLNEPSRGAVILDRNGTFLYQFVDDKEGIRKPVTLQDVSPAFLAATIATEDANFFNNAGVNPRGLLRAAWDNFSPWNREGGILKGAGGSSITQQLVKNVYIPAEQRSERSLERKLREIVYSIELTKQYDKSQILEWYVNQISYGGIYTGVEAASEGYFGKPASELTLGEAALLAGIPQSPAAYDPMNNLDAALARRDEVLSLIEKRGTIAIGNGNFYVVNHDEVEQARTEEPTINTPSFPIQAPHFVLTYVVPQLEKLVGHDALLHDGLVITTTLDLNLQNATQNILNAGIARYEAASNTHNGAAIVFQPRTGEILAMVGSRDYYNPNIAGEVNNLLAPNSPGSSFKPFVYLTAFMRLGWGPGTPIIDSPIAYREIDGSVFEPQNPIHGAYAGSITVRNALGNSLNVPAFKTALQLGAPAVLQTAKSMGFTGLNGYYGPSIAIGGIDLRAIDLAYGYTVLANDGVIRGQNALAPAARDESEIQPAAILKIADAEGNVRFDLDEHRAEKRVAPAEQVYEITDILSDPRAECQTFGCGGLSVPGYKVAVKTGTSQPFDQSGPYKDKLGETWAFGYTPDYVVGVWAGNSDNSPVQNIFSTTIAFPVMRDVMLASYNGAPETPFDRPSTLAVRRTCAPVARFPFSVQAPGARPLPPFPTFQSCGTDLAPAGADAPEAPPPPGAPSGPPARPAPPAPAPPPPAP